MTARLGVIGFGSMGSAILRGAIDADVIKPADVIVAEPDHRRRQAAASLGCITGGEPRFALDAEQIMLAVKPQVFANVAAATGLLSQPRVVISIMAGLSSGVIRQALGGGARVIRVMPNTPAQIRAGVSAIAMGEGAQPGDDAFARSMFSAVGAVVDVDESHMHAVTALSGSGPAYVFLLAESMEQAGIQLGLSAPAARELAYQTVLGAARLLTVEGVDRRAEALRSQVTSPGGTTAAAIEEMFERDLPQIVVDAIHAARDRSLELDIVD